MPITHSLVPIADHTLHVAESGDPQGKAYLFLHGWPESWRTWLGVMEAADAGARVVAIDLPGIGTSAGAVAGGSKRRLAGVVRHLVDRLELADLVLVGHDAGAVVAYAYLREHADLSAAVLMNTVVPGVDPWHNMLRNPYVWHIGLHTVPHLPETLVQGRQAEYFAYFYDTLSAKPSRISAESRAAHVEAYRTDAALTAGFDLYRAFRHDAEDNLAFAAAAPVDTPVLFVRGDGEYGDMATYANGFRDAGIRNLTTAVIADSGHFAQEEAPEQVWRVIAGFVDDALGGR